MVIRTWWIFNTIKNNTFYMCLWFSYIYCELLLESACSKVYPHHKTQSVEDMIAVTLKHAPHREKIKKNVQVRGFCPKSHNISRLIFKRVTLESVMYIYLS